jgi:phage recombination protein Bet
MTSKEITTLPSNGDVDAWTPAERAIADAAGLVFTHSYGAKEGEREPAPRAVVEKFLHVARITGLDPLTRQLYCIGRAMGSRVEWSIQTSIDGFRVVAERSSKYAGQDAAEWMTEKGEWVDCFVPSLHGKNPLAARVKVYREDWPSRPAVGVAEWSAYVGTKRDGTPTAMWGKMGALMLAKCAEALALRKAFPQDLSGLYTSDEMSQAVVESDVPAAARRSVASSSEIVEGEIVEDVPKSEASAQRASEQPIEIVQHEGARSWRELADDLTDADAVLALFNECRDAGELGLTTDVADETTGEIVKMQLRVYLRKLGEKLRQIQEAGDDGETPAVLEGS